MNTSGALGYTPVATSPELSAPPAAEGTVERVITEVESYFRDHYFNIIQTAHHILSTSGETVTIDGVIAAAEKLAAHLKAKVEEELKKL